MYLAEKSFYKFELCFFFICLSKKIYSVLFQISVARWRLNAQDLSNDSDLSLDPEWLLVCLGDWVIGFIQICCQILIAMFKRLSDSDLSFDPDWLLA